MRDDAFSRVGKDGPDYFIDGVENNVNSHIYRFKNACYNAFVQTKSPRAPLCRRISGIMSVPLYLDDFLPGSHLVISNITGLPVYQRKADVTFTVSCTYVYIHVHAQLFKKRVGYTCMHKKFPPPAYIYHLQNYGFCRMN